MYDMKQSFYVFSQIIAMLTRYIHISPSSSDVTFETWNIDGPAQNCIISITNALDIQQYYTKPPLWIRSILSAISSLILLYVELCFVYRWRFC